MFRLITLIVFASLNTRVDCTTILTFHRHLMIVSSSIVYLYIFFILFNLGKTTQRRCSKLLFGHPHEMANVSFDPLGGR